MITLLLPPPASLVPTVLVLSHRPVISSAAELRRRHSRYPLEYGALTRPPVESVVESTSHRRRIAVPRRAPHRPVLSNDVGTRRPSSHVRIATGLTYCLFHAKRYPAFNGTPTTVARSAGASLRNALSASGMRGRPVGWPSRRGRLQRRCAVPVDLHGTGLSCALRYTDIDAGTNRGGRCGFGRCSTVELRRDFAAAAAITFCAV